MRPRIRAAMSMLAASILTLTLAAGPAARAQSPSPGITCPFLTADEVGPAVGFTVTVVSGDQSGCDFADVLSGDTVLSMFIELGTVAPIKAGTPGGVDLTIGGYPAYYVSGAVWLEIGGQLLSLVAPFIADPQAGLTTLAGLAVTRLGSLSSPGLMSPAPLASAVADVGLQGLFPTDIGGTPLDVTIVTGSRGMANSDASNKKILKRLVTAVAPLGKTIDDVSFGKAIVIAATGGALLEALRVRGTDASAWLSEAIPLFLEQQPTFGTPQQATAQVGGKDVTLLTPAKKSPDAGKGNAYVYAHDDVVWFVAEPAGTGQDALAAEILQALP